MMKWIFLCLLALGISSCAGTNRTRTPTTADGMPSILKACLMTQVADKIQDGTAFSNDLMIMAKEISVMCLKKTALQSAGLEEEALIQSEALLKNLTASALASN